MRMFRRWRRSRERARELQERSFAAMDYNPERCFGLVFGGIYGNANPRLMCKRRWGR